MTWDAAQNEGKSLADYEYNAVTERPEGPKVEVQACKWGYGLLQ